jgi:SAM-dependent methyltransferase
MARKVQDHYVEHLGPIYSWMMGGVESAVARGAAELDQLSLCPKLDSLAVDLGAGIGAHTIPLAHLGYSVVAIDTDSSLLNELTAHAKGLAVRTVVAELSDFPDYVERAPDLILCMGDTLTHLPRPDCVISLFEKIASTMSRDGLLVCTFRDYTAELSAEARFIPVKSDPERILTCFLEYEEGRVTVHDILHERDGNQWRLRVSSYQKLRLAPSWVCGVLDQCGFEVADSTMPSGMVRLMARRR